MVRPTVAVVVFVVVVRARHGQCRGQNRRRQAIGPFRRRTAGRPVGLRVVVARRAAEGERRRVGIQRRRGILARVDGQVGHVVVMVVVVMVVNGDGHGQLLRGLESRRRARRLRTDEDFVLCVFDDHRVAVQLQAVAGVERLLRFFVRGEANEAVSFAHLDALDDLPVGVEDRLQVHAGRVRGEIADEEFACRLLATGRNVDAELLRRVAGDRLGDEHGAVVCSYVRVCVCRCD